jgi:hypothetical protein
MRFALVFSILSSFFATNALAASVWLCDFVPEKNEPTFIQLMFVTGHLSPGSPLTGDVLTILRSSRDKSRESEVVGTIPADSVVGYWNDGKSLKIRAVGALPAKPEEQIDVLWLEAVRVKLTESERENRIQYAYKLESDMVYRLVNPGNQSVTRNLRLKDTRITCSRD